MSYCAKKEFDYIVDWWGEDLENTVTCDDDDDESDKDECFQDDEC